MFLIIDDFQKRFLEHEPKVLALKHIDYRQQIPQDLDHHIQEYVAIIIHKSYSPVKGLKKLKQLYKDYLIIEFSGEYSAPYIKNQHYALPASALYNNIHSLEHYLSNLGIISLPQQQEHQANKDLGSILHITKNHLEIQAVESALEATFAVQSQLYEHSIDQCIDLLQNNHFDHIVLALELDQTAENFLGLELGLAIRFSTALSIEKRSLPIILYTDLKIQDIFLQSRNAYPLLLQTEGVALTTIPQIGNALLGLNGIKDFDFYRRNDLLAKIQVLPTATYGQHALSNEWALYKMSLFWNISIPLQSNLYLEYRKNQLDLNQAASLAQQECLTIQKSWNNFIKKKAFRILLIDDQREWKIIFDKIFQASKSHIQLAQNKEEALQLFHQRTDWDLIIIDLRLDRIEETIGYSRNPLKDFGGAQLLQEFKAHSPAIPCLMYTSSNKNWNAQYLVHQLGADDFCTKGSFEFHDSWEDIIQSNTKLLDVLKKLLNKGKVLQSIWQKVQAINHCIDQQHSLVIEQSTKGGKTAFQQIIKERLNMFFGLLKSKYEQSSFNEELFHFSVTELAFMTLWSSLNDIQQSYFKKLDNIGEWQLHPQLQKKLNLYHYKPLLYIVGNKSALNTDMLEFDINANFEINNYRYSQKISQQIAFLLHCLQLSSDIDAKAKIQTLKRLNYLRNHLYLTHGDKSLSEYQQTIAEKRKLQNSSVSFRECDELLEIVYLLVVGR